LQQDLVGNDVEAGVRFSGDIGDGQYGGGGIGLGAHEGVGGGDEASGDGDGIDDLFHEAGVAAFAGDPDGEVADVGEGFAVAIGKGTDGQQGVDVEAEHGIGAGEFAAFHDELSTGLTGDGAAHGAFFRGLENEFDGALEIRALQQVGRAEEHGRVDVVPAGVHDALRLGGKGNAGFFGDGQGVHIGAKDDGWAFAFCDRADDAGEGDAFGRDGQFAELRFDECGGLELGEAEFGILVQVAADRDEFVEELGVHMDKLRNK